MPPDETGTRIAAIWAEVLNRTPESILPRDNFFLLGGTSLQLVGIAARIEREWGIPLPLETALKLNTVNEMAGYVENRTSECRPG